MRKERPEPTPGTVTAVSLQVRDTNRMSIYVDGEFSFGMPAEDALQMGLAKGFELTPDRLRACLAADERYRARQKALNLLAYRPRSTGELETRLKKAGFSPPAIEHAVGRMDHLGYLDDESFARTFARERIGSGKHGSRRVLADLGRRGVRGSMALRAVEEASRERDETADALALAEKRARALPSGLDGHRKRQRLYGHLARRGFSAEAIREALSTLADGQGTEGPLKP